MAKVMEVTTVPLLLLSFLSPSAIYITKHHTTCFTVQYQYSIKSSKLAIT